MSNSQPRPTPRRQQPTPLATPGDGSGGTGFRPVGNTAQQPGQPNPQRGSAPWPDSPHTMATPPVTPGDNAAHTTQMPAVDSTATGQHLAQQPYGTPPQGTPAFRHDPPTTTQQRPRQPLDLSDDGGSVTDSPDVSDSREPRRSEPKASTPLLQRSLPKPLATLGQLGGIAALAYFAWGLLKGIGSFIMENAQGVAIGAVIIVMIVAVIFVIRKFNEREEERREREEARDAEIRRLKRIAGEDSDEDTSTSRSGPSRRATQRTSGNGRRRGNHS